MVYKKTAIITSPNSPELLAARKVEIKLQQLIAEEEAYITEAQAFLSRLDTIQVGDTILSSTYQQLSELLNQSQRSVEASRLQLKVLKAEIVRVERVLQSRPQAVAEEPGGGWQPRMFTPAVASPLLSNLPELIDIADTTESDSEEDFLGTPSNSFANRR